ncbi:GINS complex subunit [Arachnomyces sp. PD_36]|nr:GINS complex subunit [Arachnomyces sp. PD_36]
MDDIDDILASVDRDQYVSSPESTALDHQQLTRFWVAERGVPEVLPWPGPLMDRVMERVRKQVEIIEDLASSGSDLTSPTTTTTNNAAANNNNPSLNLKLSILQTDLSRTQYIIRSLLRQRLSKLTKHSMHYLLISSPPPPQPSSSEPQTPQHSQRQYQNPRHPTPLSDSELSFLRSHQSLLTSHYHASFLSTFPSQLQRLDDNAGGMNMVQGPETKSVVFVRCLVEEVRVVVASGEDGGVGGYDDVDEDDDDGMGGGKEYGATMRRGEVWVVRWEGVKGAWKRGEVEVL